MLFSKIIKKKFDAVLGRYDGDPAWYYFSPKDFPQIRSEAFDVAGDRNVTLKGYFYFYGALNPEKLVVFDHGIGAGRLGYFKEIEYMARSGWTVYAYDHSGCVDSGGTGILGFAQGVNDLDRVLSALDRDPRFAGRPRKLVGHSWGGYSAMNVVAFHPEVSHVVSLAGFLSAEALVAQYIPKLFHSYIPEVMARERENNPKYADLDARESLKKSGAKLLHFQSRDDQKVKYELCMEPLSAALQGRPGTELVTVDHKGHEPQCTEAAAAATEDLVKQEEQLLKKKQLNTKEEQDAFRKSQDWAAVTQQDPAVWAQIFQFFDQA